MALTLAPRDPPVALSDVEESAVRLRALLAEGMRTTDGRTRELFAGALGELATALALLKELTRR